MEQAQKVLEDLGLETLPSPQKLDGFGYGYLTAAISHYHGGFPNFRNILNKRMGVKLPEEKFQEYLKREDVVYLMQGMGGELRNILGSYVIDVFLQEHKFVTKNSLLPYLGEVDKRESNLNKNDIDNVLRLLNAFYQLEHVDKKNLDNVMIAALTQFYDNVCGCNEVMILKRISEDSIKHGDLSEVYDKLEKHYRTRIITRKLLGKKIVKEVKIVDVI